MRVHVCMRVCKQLPGNQSFIGKYLPTRRVVVSGGGAMDPDRQLLTSLLHDIIWGPLDHASCGPQLMSCNIYVHVYVSMRVRVSMHVRVCMRVRVCVCVVRVCVCVVHMCA